MSSEKNGVAARDEVEGGTVEHWLRSTTTASCCKESNNEEEDDDCDGGNDDVDDDDDDDEVEVMSLHLLAISVQVH